jgi:hypothetical protein
MDIAIQAEAQQSIVYRYFGYFSADKNSKSKILVIVVNDVDFLFMAWYTEKMKTRRWK